MINLCRDEDYRRALLGAELAIADSGFMVLLWKFFTGERVPRISGLEHVKRLLEHESVRQPGAVLWVVATETSRDKLLDFLEGRALSRPWIESRLDASLSPTMSADSVCDRRARTPSLPPPSRLPVHVAHPSRSSPMSTIPTIYVAPKYSRPVEDETSSRSLGESARSIS